MFGRVISFLNPEKKKRSQKLEISEGTRKLSRSYIGLRYWLACLMIATVCLFSALLTFDLETKSYSLDQRISSVVEISITANESLSAMVSLISLPKDDRAGYLQPARTQLDALEKQKETFLNQVTRSGFDPAFFRASMSLEKIFAEYLDKGRLLIGKAENGEDTPADLYAFSAYNGNQFQLVLNELSDGLEAEKQTLAFQRIYVQSGSALIILLSIAISIIWIFKPLENSIVTTQARLSERSVELELATQEAEAANNAKSDFLASMSHEIRTPMNGIMGMTELLKNSELSRQQQGFAEVILKSSKSLLRIIDDILSFSEVSAGRIHLDNRSFRISDVLDNANEKYANLAKSKGLELIWECQPGLPENCIGDPDRISQVLNQLLDNAIKFTDEGHVKVVFKEKYASTSVDEDFKLRVYVEDTGIGVPKNKKDSIFEQFSQADNSITRAHDGLGLGLAIANSILHAMGGQIGLESWENRGSVFWFEVPLKKAELAETSLAEKQPGEIQAQNVVLVSDEPALVQHIGTQLDTSTIDLAVARGIPEALSLIKAAGQHDVVVHGIILDGQAMDDEASLNAFFSELPQTCKTIAVGKEANWQNYQVDCVVAREVTARELLLKLKNPKGSLVATSIAA